MTEECWICKRTIEDMNKLLYNYDKDDEEGDIACFTKIVPEEAEDYSELNELNIKLCGICWRVFNGYIDNRFECLTKCGLRKRFKLVEVEEEKRKL